jgi:hypothetical protein
MGDYVIGYVIYADVSQLILSNRPPAGGGLFIPDFYLLNNLHL